MTIATDMLAKYLQAETAVLEGKDVSFGDRRLSMANLPEIIAGRQEWERRVAAERARANRAPTLGGLSVTVASFNRAPLTGEGFYRNGR
jgi:hypothetical protein